MKFPNIKEIFKSTKNSQVFINFFWSNIFVGTIIIIVIGFFLFKSFIHVYRSEIEYSNLRSMRVIMDTVDNQIKTLEQLAFQIGNNSQFSEFNISSGSYNLYRAVGRLSEYKTSYSFISDIVLIYDKYAKSNAKLLSDNGFNDINTFFNKTYKFRGYSSEEIIKKIEDIKIPTVISFQDAYYNEIKKTSFALYVFPIPINAVKPNNAIIFIIEQNNFDNIIKDVLSDGGDFLLLSANETMIYKNQYNKKDGFLEKAKILMQNSDNNEIYNMSIGGNKYLAVKVVSGYYNWTYINFIPEKQYMQKIFGIQRVFYIIMCIVLMFGILLSYVTAYRNYLPFSKLTKYIESSKNIELIGNKKRINEFNCIMQAFNDINQKNQNLIVKLKEMLDTLREFIIIKVIKEGNYTKDEIIEFRNALGINLSGKRFCVFSVLFDPNRGSEDYIPYNKIKEKIILVLNDQAVDSTYVFLLTDHKGIGILLLSDNLDVYDISQIADKVRETVKNSFDFTVTIGIGEICTAVKDINISYKQSHEAAKYRLVKGKDKVIKYIDFKELGVKDYEKLIERCGVLVALIKNSNKEKMILEVDRIFDHIASKNYPIKTLQLISANIFHKVIDMIQQSRINIEESVIQPIEKVILTQTESTEEFRKKIGEFCIKICDRIDNQTIGKAEILKNNIEIYLKDNFNDPNLSLTKIGDDLNMSSSYLTTFFREHTGKSIMLYVEELRIDKAKQLLCGTDLKIKDITRQVGFIDEGTFSRNFKKHESISPTKYRSLMANNKGNKPED